MNIKENQILGISDSDKVLFQRLKEMEKEKLLKIYVYTNTPIRVEYGFIVKGENLKKAMHELTIWQPLSFL